MKKFFEKHDLFKIIGITLLLVIALSWIIPSSSQASLGIIGEEITRIGINDSVIYVLLSLYYFAIIVTLLIVIGGFYEILAKTKGYRALIAKTTKFLKGKEIPFVLITSFLFASLAAISTEIYQLLVFVPLFVTLILKLKMSKITALCTTFGSILVGVIGSIYGTFIYESMEYYFGLTYMDGLYYRTVLFVVTFVLFNLFNILYLRKTIGKNIASEKTTDKFEVARVGKNAKAWPIIIVLSIVAILQIIGYIGWNQVFKVEVFQNFHDWLMGLSIGEHKIVSYIIGTASPFGAWDLYVIQIILIIASIALAIMYKINIDDLIESFMTGAKKMLRSSILMLLVFTICVLSVMYPVMPTITDWLMNITKTFNVFFAALATFLTSIFSVEFRYTAQSIAPYMTGTFIELPKTLTAVTMQAVYGLVQFVAPTSIILVAGLSYLDISYKKWLSYIWKFLLILLACIVVLITIISNMDFIIENITYVFNLIIK